MAAFYSGMRQVQKDSTIKGKTKRFAQDVVDTGEEKFTKSIELLQDIGSSVASKVRSEANTKQLKILKYLHEAYSSYGDSIDIEQGFGKNKKTIKYRYEYSIKKTVATVKQVIDKRDNKPIKSMLVRGKLKSKIIEKIKSDHQGVKTVKFKFRKD